MTVEQAVARKLEAGETPTQEEAAELLRLLREWRSIALYMVSCEAETTIGLSPHLSKKDRLRHLDICRAAKEAIEHECFVHAPVPDVETVSRRLQAILRE